LDVATGGNAPPEQAETTRGGVYEMKEGSFSLPEPKEQDIEDLLRQEASRRQESEHFRCNIERKEALRHILVNVFDYEEGSETVRGMYDKGVSDAYYLLNMSEFKFNEDEDWYDTTLSMKMAALQHWYNVTDPVIQGFHDWKDTMMTWSTY
jgi:hypothetical protein